MAEFFPDFACSFLCFRIDLKAQPAITLTHNPPTTENNARIQLEAVCEIEKPGGKRVFFGLGASCKTERVGGPGRLWLEPNADFCLVASREEFLILKQFAHRDLSTQAGAQLRQSGMVKAAWSDFHFDVRKIQCRALQTFDEIFNATVKHEILIARSEWVQNGYSVRLEYPVKTFNVSKREQVYQTDTGPHLLPDLSPARLSASTHLIECFDLAFSAFNAPDWIEFVVNAPVEVAPNLSVDHYENTRRIENARNSLWTAG